MCDDSKVTFTGPMKVRTDALENEDVKDIKHPGRPNDQLNSFPSSFF